MTNQRLLEFGWFDHSSYAPPPCLISAYDALTGRASFSYPGYSFSGSLASPPTGWVHIAAVHNLETRTVSIFQNGRAALSVSWNGTLPDNRQSRFTMGLRMRDDVGGPNFNTESFVRSFGVISNLRIVVGRALYVGDTFTVPTLPLTVVPGTRLLLRALPPRSPIGGACTSDAACVGIGSSAPLSACRGGFCCDPTAMRVGCRACLAGSGACTL